MLDTALKILNIISKEGYEAYIVGGFVRDYLMGVKSNDVDITTNAIPRELKKIFPNAAVENVDYGAVTVYFNDISFQITTYRIEESYSDKRRPDTVIYVNNLSDDLRRRDFTINSLCIDKDGKVIDLLNGRIDIDNRTIKTIIPPVKSFSLDVLRILRAVRFATTLDFELDSSLVSAIGETKHLLNDLSINRKKEELNKIFGSTNLEKGLRLLKGLGLISVLGLDNIDKVKPCSQVIGVWTSLEVDAVYPFTRNELKLMKDIRAVLNDSPLSFEMLYYYDLYVCTVAAELLGIEKKDVVTTYSRMPIHKRSDIVIDSYDIIDYLKIKEGPALSKIWKSIEESILNFSVPNDKNALLLFAKRVYTNLEFAKEISDEATTIS